MVAADPHASHHAAANTNNRVLTTLAIGGTAAAIGIILAPTVLPAIGIGEVDMAQASMAVLHGTPGTPGRGIAGFASAILSQVPWIGDELAQGGWTNTIATAVTGIGGVLLGRKLEKQGFSWGKGIRYAALATSALIALPTVMTALGAGIIFLSSLTGYLSGSMEFTNNITVPLVRATLGTLSGTGSALRGAGTLLGALPHLLTCGFSIVPLAIGVDANMKDQPTQAVNASQSVAVSLEVEKPTIPYRVVNATLKLTDAKTGEPVRDEQLKTVHTEKLHLLITDSSLQDYYHVHPTPTEEPGTYRFSFSPKTGNSYAAWADFTMENGQNFRIKTPIPSAAKRNIPARVQTSNAADIKGLHVELHAPEPLQKGKSTVLSATLSDTAGRPVQDLEPVMGAFAHLVGFSADGKSLIHTHPLGTEPSGDAARGGPQLRFHVTPDSAGPTQFYLQLRRGGEDVYIPFGQQIKSPERFSERSYTSVQSLGHAH